MWANELILHLRRTASLLSHRTAIATAATDGLILWDAVAGYPVVARAGVWREVALAGEHAQLTITGDVTAAAANTAYSLTWDTPTILGAGITVSTTDITFGEAGLFAISYGAQLRSSLAGQADVWMWLTVNGTDQPQTLTRVSLDYAGAVATISREVLLQLAAADVVRLRWAVSDVALILSEEASTAFAPVTRAAVMTIKRIAA